MSPSTGAALAMNSGDTNEHEHIDSTDRDSAAYCGCACDGGAAMSREEELFARYFAAALTGICASNIESAEQQSLAWSDCARHAKDTANEALVYHLAKYPDTEDPE